MIPPCSTALKMSRTLLMALFTPIAITPPCSSMMSLMCIIIAPKSERVDSLVASIASDRPFEIPFLNIRAPALRTDSATVGPLNNFLIPLMRGPANAPTAAPIGPSIDAKPFRIFPAPSLLASFVPIAPRVLPPNAAPACEPIANNAPNNPPPPSNALTTTS